MKTYKAVFYNNFSDTNVCESNSLLEVLTECKKITFAKGSFIEVSKQGNFFLHFTDASQI
jgi:hypothetical protein